MTQPESGTIANAVARLARWGTLAPHGLARVQTSSEFTRQEIVAALRPALESACVPLHEIALPMGRPAGEIVGFLVEELRGKSGVVSISGFQAAFDPNISLADSLHVLNFHREALTQTPIRQIWWMPPSLATQFARHIPDLDSWFIVRLHITEIGHITATDPQWAVGTDTHSISTAEAEQESASFAARFHRTLKLGADATDILLLIVQTVTPLQRAGQSLRAGRLLNELLAEAATQGVTVTGILAASLNNDCKTGTSSQLGSVFSGLAELYWAQGAYDEALPLFKKALEILEHSHGLEDPALAVSLNGLANLLESQGRYEEALPLFERALAIREKSLGQTTPDVASSLNDLAGVYYWLGRYEDATRLIEKALEIRERSLGPRHPTVANSLNSLACLHTSLGRYDQAVSLHERALKIRENALGLKHPDVANSLNNLANVYEDLGRDNEAQAINERALAIREDALGPEHPDLATTLNNLANGHFRSGRYQVAQQMCWRAITINENALGLEHPMVAINLNNLAEMFRAQRRYDEALPLCLRAIAILEKAFGPDHPAVATSLNNLALLYEAQGLHDDAQRFYQHALDILERNLGSNHPRTKLIRKNFAA